MSQTILRAICSVIWYVVTLGDKAYVLQLQNHSHMEPPNVRPPKAISQSLRIAFLHSFLDKGSRTQLSYHAVIDSIVDQHGQYYFGKNQKRYDKNSAMRAFFPFRNDPSQLHRVLLVETGTIFIVHFKFYTYKLITYFIFNRTS